MMKVYKKFLILFILCPLLLVSSSCKRVEEANVISLLSYLPLNGEDKDYANSYIQGIQFFIKENSLEEKVNYRNINSSNESVNAFSALSDEVFIVGTFNEALFQVKSDLVPLITSLATPVLKNRFFTTTYLLTPSLYEEVERISYLLHEEQIDRVGIVYGFEPLYETMMVAFSHLFQGDITFNYKITSHENSIYKRITERSRAFHYDALLLLVSPVEMSALLHLYAQEEEEITFPLYLPSYAKRFMTIPHDFENAMLCVKYLGCYETIYFDQKDLIEKSDHLEILNYEFFKDGYFVMSVLYDLLFKHKIVSKLDRKMWLDRFFASKHMYFDFIDF